MQSAKFAAAKTYFFYAHKRERTKILPAPVLIIFDAYRTNRRIQEGATPIYVQESVGLLEKSLLFYPWCVSYDPHEAET